MLKLYLDTETCGLHSIAVLIQYAINDGPIVLHDVWKKPVKDTLRLIEKFCECTVIAFNLSFDWYHICKLYTMWRLLPEDWIPEDHIEEIVMKEEEAMDGPCLKPVSCLDLLMYSRKQPYQSLMARKPIRIKRIPIQIVGDVRETLEEKVKFDDIYFAKRADKTAPKWKILDILDKSGRVDPCFQDIELKFRPSMGLKYITEFIVGLKPKHYFEDVEIDKKYHPYELGYAPFANAVAHAPDWQAFDITGKYLGLAWPALVKEHINHWANSEPAREYARDDVEYLRKLEEFFQYPEPGDDDSILTCMVAAVRWHGFTLDHAQIDLLMQKALVKITESPINVNKPRVVREYLLEMLDDVEMIISFIAESTKRANLEKVATWTIDKEEQCTKCQGKGCLRCNNTGRLTPGKHPVAVRAQEILSIKFAHKEIDLYTKLKRAKKFHPTFDVSGTLSGRMSGSGSGGLNAQGIKHTKEVRKLFKLLWGDYLLCGGDFDSFEVTLGDVVYDDENLHASLLRGEKLHALLAMQFHPGVTYEEVLATDGKDPDFYMEGKRGVFGMFYGGDHTTWERKIGIPEHIAKQAEEWIFSRHPGILKSRNDVKKDFCSMTQPGGIGKRIFWVDPKEYVETLLGDKRYFTLENKTCKALFELASHAPPTWKTFKVKVMRRTRLQTPQGAAASALFSAAFQLQAACMRAANNHLIQSLGARITKTVQRRIWDLQPAGVKDWIVCPMNYHDEVECVTHRDYAYPLAETVKDAVESYRELVPLIGMKWCLTMDNWADKGHGAKIMHVSHRGVNWIDA